MLNNKQVFFINKVLCFPLQKHERPNASLPEEIYKNCSRFLRLFRLSKTIWVNSFSQTVRSAEYHKLLKVQSVINCH